MIAAKKLILMGSALTDADARALVMRMSPRPNKTRQEAIQALIVDLKARGLWTLLRDLFVMAAHAEQPSRLNWRAIRDISWNGAVPFIIDRGIRSSASETAVFDYDNVTPGNHTFGVWWLQDALPTGLTQRIAGIDSIAELSDYRRGNGVVGIAGSYLNQVAYANVADRTTPLEAMIGMRAENLRAYAYFNGDGGSGERNRPLTRVQETFGVNACRVGTTFSATTAATFRACWTGSLMTATQTDSLRAALTIYLQKIGAIA